MAYRVLFPLASLYAIGAIPVWLALRITHTPLTNGSWHGHEMLFGFALAVVAGFLSMRASRFVTIILAGTWFAARIAAGACSSPLAACAGMAFPLTVVIVTVPALFRKAKRPENLILPSLVTAVAITDAVWWVARVRADLALQTHVLVATVDLFALLLLLVGGRALRGTVGVLLERQGIERRDRVWRRYELPLAALIGGSALCDALGLAAGAGALCVGAAALAISRLLPRQIHRTIAQPSVWSLALGFLWLVAGLAAKGLAQLVGTAPVADVLHGISIGALGTFTLVMMSRYSAVRARRPLSEFADVGLAVSLVSVATVIRLLVPVIPSDWDWLLWLAAATWSGAFLLLSLRLWRAFRPPLGTGTVGLRPGE